MPLRIDTNISSLIARRSIANHQKQIQSALSELASGSRLNSAHSDPAQYAISNELLAQTKSLDQARLNARMAQSLTQTAEGALNEQNNILIRLRELAVGAASDTMTDKDRSYANREFTQLIQEFSQIARATRFGSKRLLTGENNKYLFEVGPDAGGNSQIQFTSDANTQASAVGIDDLDISEKDDARDALSSIDEALNQVADIRARFGAVQSRLNYAIDNLDVQKENEESARSTIADTDVAQATSKLVKSQILNQAAVAVLAQANAGPKAALSLIGE